MSQRNVLGLYADSPVVPTRFGGVWLVGKDIAGNSYEISTTADVLAALAERAKNGPREVSA